MPDTDEGNQKVTNALLKRDIDNISKKLEILPKIQDQLNQLDKKMVGICSSTENNKEDILEIKSKVTYLERRDVLGAAIAASIASLIGIFTGRQ